MIYDRPKAARMLRVVAEVTEGALELAGRPGGEPSLRRPALETEKTMRTLAAKGDVDGMYQEYLRALQTRSEMGETLHRQRRISLESELYRFAAIYWEREP
ncbi:MAG: hypothetical protein ACE5JH_01075 [Acidobacteriota bacterium]